MDAVIAKAQDINLVAQQRKTAAALGLLQRLPPQDLESDFDALVSIDPGLEQSLAPYVTRPLKVKLDTDASRYFVACEYNCDRGSHRSPWSNRYIPAPEGLEEDQEEEEAMGRTLSEAPGRIFKPSDRLRGLEQSFNEVFSAYTQAYYEGGVSSVYLWDLDEGFAGAFLVHKELPKSSAISCSGVWDSVHVLEVKESASSHFVDYKLSSTVLMHSQDPGKVGTTEVGGHLTRQAESRLDRRKRSAEDMHIVHVGGMIEDNENALRLSLDSVCVAKQQTILESMRSLEPLESGAQAAS
eukprot:TRINITY_DN45916_c0_g1_i1.p1 TRINITY_DN45916_c0_g1~~TRINITY_DN45916_c0_g1_i1.p1  ORF type:complete len:297 (-),score=56.07 TRINITY_DN45916_c0_g1_i1:78-968(-)